MTQVYELGTKYENVCEYGYDLVGGYGGFSVDLADYMTSNGVFTLSYPEGLVKDGQPTFFKITVEDYAHR